MCQSKGEGGIGMIEMRNFNMLLLGKWIWRLGKEENGLWKEVVVSKYGGWRKIRAQEVKRYNSLWWKDLKEVWRFQGWKGNFEDNIV